ncbi:cAMP phosphodiesterase [Reticulomyxa filosa]|uniref:Phosphodiesterase n=1 Tax=Reticulomyxa filosa TaxID=46433 RepID=X6P1M4_RETFI|nr:cAMP phosphodiesterase [Reticulomyxa filosa]|eukprot:ETO32435.1 cAMP phosphodiesterase [Reticulomyxa filosa]
MLPVEVGGGTSDLGGQTPNTVIFDLVDHSKWSLDTLMEIPTLEDFSSYVEKHDRDDIVKLCWDLLRSNEKCGELLHMVTAMNQDLQDEERAFDHMMTTTKISLDCSFVSLYVVEDDRRSLRCLCTSQGICVDNAHQSDLDSNSVSTSSVYSSQSHTLSHGPSFKVKNSFDVQENTLDMDENSSEKETVVYVSHVTEQESIPAKVFRTAHHVNCAVHRSEIAAACPEYSNNSTYRGDMFVLGVPVRDRRGTIIGVLMVYRENNSNTPEFNEADIKTASVLTAIACNTLQNLQTYIDAQIQKKDSARVLGIIDEMSGDITNQSYQQLIKQLLRKIRGLVTCQELEFWTINGPAGQKVLTCEISQDTRMQNQQILVESGHILGQVALTGLPKKIDRARVDGRYTANELRYSKGESVLVIPVRLEHESHPIAIIQAINKIPRALERNGQTGAHGRRRLHQNRVVPFTENDKRLLETLAKSASVIIRNNQLFESMQGERKKNIALVSILRALQHKHDVTQMLDDATLCIAHALDCERVNIWFSDGNGELESLNVMTNSESSQENNGFNVNNMIDEDVNELLNGIAKYCAMEHVYVSSVSIYQDTELWNAINDDYIQEVLFHVQQRHPSQLYRVQSASTLCVPISANGRVVGVIQASFKANDSAFTDLDLSIVEAISNEVAHAIARNISDLWIQKYIEKHEDVPLEVIDYFLTGSHDQYYEVMDGDMEESKIGQERTSGGGKKLMITFGDGDNEEMETPYLNVLEMDEFQKNTLGDDWDSKVINVKLELPKHLRPYVQQLDTCEFDCTQYQAEHLEQFVLYLLQETGMVKEFKLNIVKLSRFVHQVQKSYHDNPFHNWQHGFFVFHFVYYFITKVPKIKLALKKLDLLAILIAGLCHDINHPGNDNLYEINIESELSRIYNGESVLENHHAFFTNELFRKNEFNFIEDMPVPQQKEFKRIVIKSILTTDMSHHTETIEWIHDMSKKSSLEQLMNPNNKDMKDSDKKTLLTKLCQIIVHLGDLSAQTYIWKIAKEWEYRIAEEFRKQTIKEEQVKIPVREWMAKTDIPTRYKNQHFFIEHVVKPLWYVAFLKKNLFLSQIFFIYSFVFVNGQKATDNAYFPGTQRKIGRTLEKFPKIL